MIFGTKVIRFANPEYNAPNHFFSAKLQGFQRHFFDFPFAKPIEAQENLSHDEIVEGVVGGSRSRTNHFRTDGTDGRKRSPHRRHHSADGKTLRTETKSKAHRRACKKTSPDTDESGSG